MPAKKSSWPQFHSSIAVVQWQLYQDGDPAGYIELAGTATEQNFAAQDGSSYRVEVHGRTAAVEATIDDATSGNGGGGA